MYTDASLNPCCNGCASSARLGRMIKEQKKAMLKHGNS